jgi:hypothetical protein
MAAYYATNSATGVNDLMDKLRTELVTNSGFTENSYITEGNGKRLHVTKNGMTFNIKSFIGETTPAGGVTQTGIFMNAGTGYNGANAWHDQTGVLKYNSNAAYLIPGMVQLTGAIVAYHYFHFSDTNYEVVYFFVESPAGTYQRLLFGRLDRSKMGSHWTSGVDGMFYQGSQSHNNSAYSNSLTLFGENQSGYWNEGRPKGALYGTVNGTTAWMSGDFAIPQAQFSPSRVQCFDSISKSGSVWLDSPNTFNSAPIQLPILLFVTLDASQTPGVSNTVPYSAVGELPFLYWVNILNISPGSNISVSTTNYKCFPFRKKSDVWNSNDTTVGTYRFGLSVQLP